MTEKNKIIIKGARLNNLKNISINIPKNKLVVITGVSGSGKSTLAYDTIYAESQRRYVESLSSYARQFLKSHNKPEFDEIKGLSPSIAIQNKTSINNARSTVGTITEIYHYITLLYEKLGEIYSPISGKKVKIHTFSDLKKYISTFKTNTKFLICCPIKKEQIKQLEQEGYSRIIINEDIITIKELKNPAKNIKLVIDRLKFHNNSDFYFILREAFQKAIEIGDGECEIYNQNGIFLKNLNTKLKLDKITFHTPSKDLFNFNNPYGACVTCNGHGDLIDIDEEKVIPNQKLTILQNAIHPWKNGKMEKWKNALIKEAQQIKFPIDKKYFELTEIEKKILWDGKNNWKGINAFFDFLQRKSYKIQYRIMLARYRGLSKCKKCNGTRLKPESQYILINKKSIGEITNLSMIKLLEFINGISTNKHKTKIINKIQEEITHRIKTLINLGLDYLTLNRKSNSLSGGENQRINIAKAIGSVLVGSIYILDEPTIGLHARDTNKLLRVLWQLKELGNSVIVVEHDKNIIKHCDYIIDLGPKAGLNGGEIIYHGKIKKNVTNSLTLQYINNQEKIRRISEMRTPTNFIKINSINKHNLKNLNAKIPMHVFTAITGVSGSGKSTLLKEIILPAIKRKLKDYNFKTPNCDAINVDLGDIENIEFIDQHSIKKSSTSTPITYIKAFDHIRHLFASQPLSKINNLRGTDFSFNTSGGRCENCKGKGHVIIEMQFLADIKITCEECKGMRYKEKVLNILFEHVNISQLLDYTIQEGYNFFNEHNQTRISSQMEELLNVGLGYLKLGQGINTLSSGELQRLKLASFLTNKTKKSIFIFDEPTRGLHFHDVNILLKALENLVQNGNTVIVIEHNIDIIKNVDWVIDLGPDGGENGGQIIFSGTPKKLSKEKSHTGLALQEEINH
ncbi:MAG: excinuclease ABC subunit A [Flavobacteriales bacterium]|nr:excinuclease ABC subunit A [Flavobacteriales bacterium]